MAGQSVEFDWSAVAFSADYARDRTLYAAYNLPADKRSLDDWPLKVSRDGGQSWEGIQASYLRQSGILDLTTVLSMTISIRLMLRMPSAIQRRLSFMGEDASVFPVDDFFDVSAIKFFL